MKRWLQSLLGATVVFTAWWVLPPHTEPGGSPRTRVKPETTAAMGFPWDRASSAPSPGDGVGLAAQSPLATVSPPVFVSGH